MAAEALGWCLLFFNILIFIEIAAEGPTCDGDSWSRFAAIVSSCLSTCVLAGSLAYNQGEKQPQVTVIREHRECAGKTYNLGSSTKFRATSGLRAMFAEHPAEESPSTHRNNKVSEEDLREKLVRLFEERQQLTDEAVCDEEGYALREALQRYTEAWKQYYRTNALVDRKEKDVAREIMDELGFQHTRKRLRVERLNLDIKALHRAIWGNQEEVESPA